VVSLVHCSKTWGSAHTSPPCGKRGGITGVADSHVSQAFPRLQLAPRGTPRKGAHARGMSRFFLFHPVGHIRQRERCHNARAGFASVAQVCLTAPPRLLVCLRNTGWPWFRQPPITQQELRRLAMCARFRSRDAWHSLGCCSATRQLFRENQPGGTAKKKRNT
jgi:hypothetical protein